MYLNVYSNSAKVVALEISTYKEQPWTESQGPLSKDIYASQVNKDFIWAKVIRIEDIGEEHVYDIEVEGTHNFIGNDIVAHNTYLNSNLTVDTTDNVLFVDTTNNNVGIGTTTANERLNVSGNIATTGKIITPVNVTIGSGASATGTDVSVAIGRVATASASRSIALGAATASADDTIAIGTSTIAVATATQPNAIAIGRGASSTASDTIAIGLSASASSSSGIAIGKEASSSGLAIALGPSATASGDTTIALGVSASVSGRLVTALGPLSAAGTLNTANLTAIGPYTNATANNSIVIGIGAGNAVADRLTNNLTNSFMIGYQTSPLFFINLTDGRTGINTTSPTHTLNVVGTANITSNTTIDSADSTFHVDATNNRVGIGTTGPGDPLHVRSGNVHTYIRVDNANAAPGDTGLSIFQSGVAKGYIIRQDGLAGLSFFSGGGSAADRKMFIGDSGNVGIGTTNPQSLLHVNSTTSNVYIQLPVNNTAIASTDCDANSEWGRMIAESGPAFRLWVCYGTNGWKSVTLS